MGTRLDSEGACIDGKLLETALDLGGDPAKDIAWILGVDTAVGTNRAPTAFVCNSKFPPPSDRAPILSVCALDGSGKARHVEVIICDETRGSEFVLRGTLASRRGRIHPNITAGVEVPSSNAIGIPENVCVVGSSRSRIAG